MRRATIRSQRAPMSLTSVCNSLTMTWMIIAMAGARIAGQRSRSLTPGIWNVLGWRLRCALTNASAFRTSYRRGSVWRSVVCRPATDLGIGETLEDFRAPHCHMLNAMNVRLPCASGSSIMTLYESTDYWFETSKLGSGGRRHTDRRGGLCSPREGGRGCAPGRRDFFV